MSPADQYKKFENRIFDFLSKQFYRVRKGLRESFNRFMTVGKQRFTVMFIPHSEKKIFNFRLTVFSMVFIGLLLVGVLVTFFVFSTRFSGLSRMLAVRSEDLESTQANLEIIRDEITEVNRVSRNFRSSLSKTLTTLGISGEKDYQSLPETGDLSSFFNVEEQSDGVLKELSELQSLRKLLEESSDSLKKVSDLIASQADLLVDLPTYWPVEGGVGRVTALFGPADHPFTHQWYLHKGMDIAYRKGIPVVAAANGKVIERKYDALGFGNYVLIRHSYGFQTKYGHLDSVYVDEGDTVTQGQKIGAMGNTGLSTGPHLHFEVRIGSQVVDPARFLNVKVGSR
jgi:murein DD-endopeptidase MepM/ murein hydrolase activator NlpD